jgi:large subunit ribosomal protein L4
MKLSVFNNKGKKDADIDVKDVVFGVPAKPSVMHQVYVAIEANAREPWAHTKTKDEVRGGGRKPWRQKGTGRARHGSNRSPIWKGGGVTFGPRKNRNYSKLINKKMKQLATRMALSMKVKSEKLYVVEGMEKIEKTKDMSSLMNALPTEGKTTLVLAGDDDKLGLIVRNIPKVNLQRAIDVNIVDLMHHQNIVATKNAIETLESRFV